VQRILLQGALGVLIFAGTVSGDEPSKWPDYRVIMWIGDSAFREPAKLPLFFQRMREMGVTAGMVHGEADPKPFLDAGFPYYVENMVNRGLCLKWNAKVADWEKHVTAWKDKRGEDELVREYCLDDPEWQRWAREKVQGLARRHAANKPLAYDLRDELSVTMSANPFDYDFSPAALAGFRDWLKTQYSSIEALNAAWHTEFRDWNEVKPFTTDQIKNRMSGGLGAGKNGEGFPRGKPDWQALQKLQGSNDSDVEHSSPLLLLYGSSAQKKMPYGKQRLTAGFIAENSHAWNFAPWCDHRAYMDRYLSHALGRLREDIREIDPRTPVGIEGTQMPAAFGGYDLWRLSQVLDWVEPYDIGNAREILGSFMRGKPLLTTLGEQDAKAAQRRLWHLLLEGDSGCIIWWSEDCIDWKDPEYALTSRARALAPILKELQSPLARLFLRAEPEVDPIAIHYSQPSIQVNWLIESTVDGSTWLRRFSSHEAAYNRMTQRRQAWVKLLQDAGYTPQFISSEQIERGELKDMKALVLCNSLALSDKECRAIDEFAKATDSRNLFGSGNAGLFDQHGRPKPRPEFRSWPVGIEGDQITWSTMTIDGLEGKITVQGNDLRDWLPQHGNGAKLSLSVLPSLRKLIPLSVDVPFELAVRTHRYRLGPARVFAFERNVVWQMGEDLKQHGGNAALEKPVSFEAKLSTPAHVYDLRSGKYVGHVDAIPVDLDPWRTSLFALLERKLEEGQDVVTALGEQ
jgi:Beta-galactosidase